MLLAILLPLLCIGVCSAVGDEPKCTRFEFEKHLLEMLVRLEFELSQTNQKLGLTEEAVKMEVEKLKQIDLKRGTELAKFRDQSSEIIQNLNEKLAREIEDGIQSMELKLTNSASGTSVPLVHFFGTNPEATLKKERPIFRTVFHQERESYDVPTGVFTCRVKGLYHFAFGFTTRQDAYAYCWMYKNGGRLVHAYSIGIHNSGSIAAYMYLYVGNTVDIRCSYWHRILHDNSMWFTGALIHA